MKKESLIKTDKDKKDEDELYRILDGEESNVSLVSNKEEPEENNNTLSEKFGVNLNSTDPIRELNKINDYYINARKNREDEDKYSMGLEKIEMPSEVDEDAIKNDLTNKYDALKSDKNEDYLTNIEKQENNKISAQKNYKDSAVKIESAYDEAKENASADLLKRGLARSSIAVLSINGLEQEKTKQLTNLASELADKITSIDKEISKLKDEQEDAMDLLDIKFASELEDKIKAEQEKYYKLQKEAIEFNNNVKKLEKEYGLKKEKQDAELNEVDDSDYLSDEEAEYKVLYITNYLNSLSREEALKKLVSDSMFAYLLKDSYREVYLNQLRREN
ncbi:MAG: hypothetical protein J5689_02755 [Clostridia bacterium]|nr:hypothetical protein [Clostridia bacterium]